MARKSNETKAREMAAKLGVELDDNPGGMDTFTVEIWSNDAHLHEAGNPTCHTIFIHLDEGEDAYSFSPTTIPQVWRDVLVELKDLQHCEPDCCCYE